jgi:hypothetical protein
MGSVNSGKPIVLNGGSAYVRDIKGLSAALTGVAEAKQAGGRLGRLRASVGKVFGRNNRQGGK